MRSWKLSNKKTASKHIHDEKLQPAPVDIVYIYINDINVYIHICDNNMV